MLGAVVSPIELSLMCQAVSVSRMRPGIPAFAYSVSASGLTSLNMPT